MPNVTADFTSEQREYLAKEKTFSKKYLFFYNPPTVFSCELSSIPETNNKVVEVEYDNATGDYEDVEKNMTCYVGTVAGSYDLGMVRIRKEATNDTLFIGECSDVKWDYDGTVYLTVVDELVLWAKHPTLQSNGTVKMDYDIEYDDQHENFMPIVNVGNYPCAWLESETVDIKFDASGSWSFLAGGKTYLWECETGTIDDDDISNPTITFSASGIHKVYCTVTIGGVSKTRKIYAFVFDDNFMPVENFKILSHSGDFENGGWELEVEVYETDAQIRNNCLAILFTKDIFGSEEEYYMGAELYRENICFQGWVQQEQLEYNPIEGYSTFTIKSPNGIMQSIQAFTDGIESSQTDPTTWLDIKNLTVDKAIWHLLEWRSTCLDCFDWYPTNDDRFVKRMQVGETKLWEQVSINLEAITARACFNKYGILYTEVEQQLIDPDERDFPEIEFTSDDWSDRVNVTRFTESQYSRVELSGIYFQEGIQPKAIFSLSAGHVFKKFGSTQSVTELALWSQQSKANLLAGLMLAFLNHEYEIELQTSWECRILDICPRQRINLDIEASYSSRGIPFQGNIIPRTIDYNENENGSSYYVINGESEIFPENNIDGDIPNSPTTDLSMPSFGSFLPTPLELGNYYLPPSIEVNEQPKEIVGASANFGVFYTKDFHMVNPAYYFMNSGLSSSEILDIYNLIVTPIGAVYIQLYSAEKVLRASQVGAPFVEVANASHFATTYGEHGIHSIAVNPSVPDQILIVGLGYFEPIVSEPGRVRLCTNGILGSPAGEVRLRTSKGTSQYINGKWYVMGSHYGVFPVAWICRYSASGGFEYDGSIATGATDAFLRFSQALPDSIFQWDDSGVFGFNIITDLNGTPNATLDTSFKPNHNIQGWAFSPTGINGMGSDTDVLNRPYRTTDGGASFSIMTGTLPLGTDVWENCKSENRFIFGGGTALRLTMDLGANYFNKTGNLLLIAPLIDITHLRFIK